MKKMEEVHDLREFLTIFSLGDELNREILRFICQDSPAFFNDDNTEEVLSESSDDSFESDLYPGEITDEYYDSDSN